MPKLFAYYADVFIIFGEFFKPFLHFKMSP